MMTKIKDYTKDFQTRVNKYIKNEITSEENVKMREDERFKNQLHYIADEFISNSIHEFDLTVQHAIRDVFEKEYKEIFNSMIDTMVKVTPLDERKAGMDAFADSLKEGFAQSFSTIRDGLNKQKSNNSSNKEEAKQKENNYCHNSNSKGENKNKKPSKAENKNDKAIDAVIVPEQPVAKVNEQKAIYNDTLFQLKELWIEKIKEIVKYQENLKFLSKDKIKEFEDILCSIRESIIPADIMNMIKTIKTKEESEQFLAEACEEQNYKAQINNYVPELLKYIEESKSELKNKKKPSIEKIEKSILDSKMEYPNLEPVFGPDGTVIYYLTPDNHIVNPDSAACMKFRPYPNYCEENGRILINNPLLTSVYNAVLSLGIDCTITEQNNIFGFQVFKNDYIFYKPFYVDLNAMLYTAMPKIIIPNNEDTIENSCMFSIDRLDILAAYITNTLTQTMLNEVDIINDSYRMVGSIVDLSTVPVELRDGIVKELDSHPTISEALTYDSNARFRFETADDEKVVFISDSSVRDSVLSGTSKRKLQRLFVEPNKVQLVNDETVKQQKETEKKVEEDKQQPKQDQNKQPKQDQNKQPKQDQNKQQQKNKKK